MQKQSASNLDVAILLDQVVRSNRPATTFTPTEAISPQILAGSSLAGDLAARIRNALGASTGVKKGMSRTKIDEAADTEGTPAVSGTEIPVKEITTPVAKLSAQQEERQRYEFASKTIKDQYPHATPGEQRDMIDNLYKQLKPKQ